MLPYPTAQWKAYVVSFRIKKLGTHVIYVQFEMRARPTDSSADFCSTIDGALRSEKLMADNEELALVTETKTVCITQCDALS